MKMRTSELAEMEMQMDGLVESCTDKQDDEMLGNLLIKLDRHRQESLLLGECSPNHSNDLNYEVDTNTGLIYNPTIMAVIRAIIDLLEDDKEAEGE